MSWRNLSQAGLCLGTMLMFAGTAVWAQTSATSKSPDESKRAGRLLRDIRSDAAQIQSAAAELDRLATTSGATWVQYDRQWNVMKPAEEDMQLRLARLEKMDANLSPAQRDELNQSRTLIQQIHARTHALRALLDQNGVQMNDSHFHLYAVSLKRDSSKLQRTVKVS